ncbi:MAG TPA: hypothetical protein PLA85_07775 [Micropepsaceae bacterium]|nr:hypothetical protein [Micropepsaceae bacterium]
MRQAALALALCTFALPAIASEAPEGSEAMILKAEALIQESCGAPITVDVRWGTFGLMSRDDGAEVMRSDLKFLTDALREVCADVAMKESLAAQVQSIVLPQAGGAPDPMIYIHEGALHVEYYWVIAGAAPTMEVVRDDIIARLKGEEMEMP